MSGDITTLNQILKLFNHEVDGSVTEEIIRTLQDWKLIPINLKCPNGHFYALRVRQRAKDGFYWSCTEWYQNTYRKRVKCNSTASLRKNTFFEKSKLSLYKIVAFSALWLEGVTLNFIKKQLQITGKTAVDWASFHREVVIHGIKGQEQLGGPGMTVEIDESKIGKRKYHRGHAVEGQWVFGGIERGTNRCFLVPVEERSKKVLLEIIKKYIKANTTIISGCWKSYDCLSDEGFEHLTVNHSLHFKDPETGANTNNIENLWRHVKASFPEYTRKNSFFRGYLAKFIFKRQCRANNLEPLSQFFKYAGELYNPSAPENWVDSDVSDEDII